MNVHRGNERLSPFPWLSKPGWVGTLAVTSSILLVLWVCFWEGRGSREPVYHGKALTLWLRTYTSSSARNSPAWIETDETVRHMGTNCIPTLLRLIQERDSNLKLRLIALARKQRLIKTHFILAAERNVQASRAFIVLGDSGKAAVPALVKLHERAASADSQSAIEDALAWIGPAAKPATFALLQAATNSNPRVRANALWAMGDIGAEPALCIPALIQALSDPDDWTRLSAAHALGKFGSNAQVALPALEKLTNVSALSRPGLLSMKLQVRLEARGAVQEITAGDASPSNEPIPEAGIPPDDQPGFLK